MTEREIWIGFVALVAASFAWSYLRGFIGAWREDGARQRRLRRRLQNHLKQYREQRRSR